MFEKRSYRLVRIALAAVGFAVVFYGAADVLSRASRHTLQGGATSVAFSSAYSAIDPTAAPGLVFATSSQPLVPAKLVIPAIGVEAKVEAVGKKPDGSMAAPSSFETVAWYAPGSKPGELGGAVIAGHVNNALTTAGVFEHLANLKLGEYIDVYDASGRALRFAVRDIEDYPEAQAPLSTIFSTSSPSQLVLITCAGDWDPKARSYDHRLVVYAGLIQ